MDTPRIVLARGLSGLAALGLEESRALFEPAAPAPASSPRAELLERTEKSSRVRLPLPGTPDESGRLTGVPGGGAGTGWIVLRRWRRTPWRELVHARFTRPRSTSLAEREWNLLCHLQAHGVGTPQPLAVGARGAGPVARDSFLVTRELEGFRPARSCLERGRDPARRRLELRAVGIGLDGIARAGVRLPRLGLSDLFLSAPAGDADCSTPEHKAGLRTRRLPSLVVADVGGGSLRGRPGATEIGDALLRLAHDLLHAEAPDEEPATWRELAGVFLFATRSLDRSRRRALWSGLVSRLQQEA